MKDQTSNLNEISSTMVSAIQRRLVNRLTPLLVAIDGGSGCGKSTLAEWVARELAATLIQSDDFFAANIPEAEWDRRAAEEKVRDCIDWRRLRAEVLEPLLAGKPAKWRAFDFEAGLRPDGTYAMKTEFEIREPAAVIILDGIYSARPELADLVDLTVLVDVPVAVRHTRLAAREEASFLETWHARWDVAEEHYLTKICPLDSFDFVVKNE
jgi:uridine kinase